MDRRRAWALALVATLTMAISYIDRQTFAVLAPTVTRELSLSESQYGTLLAAFSFAYLVGAPLAGRLVDRAGARRALPLALVLWTVIAATHSLAASFGVLLALRVALGLAEAPSFPGAAQTVQRALPPHERARGMGVLFTGSSIGAMLAPKLATALQGRFGWQGAFLGSALVGLVWLPLWLLLTSGDSARRALDLPAQQQDLPPVRRVLRDPAVLRAVLVVVASAPAISFALLWGAKYLVAVHHVPPAKVGDYLWLPPLLYDVGSVIFGDQASRRRDQERPARALIGVAALLVAVMTLVPWGGSTWGSLGLLGVAMAGGGGLYAVATADMMARVPPSAVSTAGGITAAAQSLTYIVLNPLLGRFLDRGGSYQTILIALGLWVLPGSLVWIFLTRERSPTRRARVTDGG